MTYDDAHPLNRYFGAGENIPQLPVAANEFGSSGFSFFLFSVKGPHRVGVNKDFPSPGADGVWFWRILRERTEENLDEVWLAFRVWELSPPSNYG